MIDPVCFTIGQRPIYWYGVMTALGFLAAVVHWNILGRRDNRPVGYGSDLGFWLMLTGILGARIAYVLANLGQYASAPLDVLRIDKGGLIYYGGFICASACLYLMARLRREPLWSLADFAITGIPLGHAMGRIGCFLNACCYGSPTDSSWCVYAAGANRHPVQLYETAANLAIYLVLLAYYPRKKKDGAVFALYLTLYPIWRFLIEFLRGDERAQWLGLNAAQVVSLLLLAAGLMLWWMLPNRRFHPGKATASIEPRKKSGS